MSSHSILISQIPPQKTGRDMTGNEHVVMSWVLNTMLLWGESLCSFPFLFSGSVPSLLSEGVELRNPLSLPSPHHRLL